VPPAGAATAAKPAGLLRRTTGSAAVALTFDDGPHPYWTPRILAVLRQHRVKATFCLVGTEVRAHPGLVGQIAREGHTLCNHSMRHDFRLRHKSPQRIAADLRQTNDLISRAAGGAQVRYFRAPGGNWSPKVVGVAAQLGMASLHWTVDPQDWRRPPASRIVANVKSTTRPGAVVLLHDAGGERPATYAAMKTLLPYLLGRFKLVAL
jgi:peptidoglycan/xylan/chitin deacetylase (PgdA/CDA1 family)